MDEGDEVGGGIEDSDVLEDAEMLLAHSRLQNQRVGCREGVLSWSISMKVLVTAERKRWRAWYE